jgi:hypothetical protein
MASPKCSTAYLRRQVFTSRTRFMGSIASGEGIPGAAQEYTNAIRQYRIAIFAKIHAHVGISHKA